MVSRDGAHQRGKHACARARCQLALHAELPILVRKGVLEQLVPAQLRGAIWYDAQHLRHVALPVASDAALPANGHKRFDDAALPRRFAQCACTSKAAWSRGSATSELRDGLAVRSGGLEVRARHIRCRCTVPHHASGAAQDRHRNTAAA